MKRQPANLSESLCHRLNSYALAASAAGVGMLALAQPAEAKIVYTPTNVKIVPHEQHGFLDFDLVCNTFSGNGRESTFLVVKWLGTRGNKVVMQFRGSDNLGAAALKVGRTIGPRDPLSSYAMMADVGPLGSYISGLWANRGKGVKNRYLGVEFKISGQTHYGWARLSMHFINQPYNRIIARLTGYAYETIPNKSIITGKTKGPDVITVQEGSLGTLAAGRK